MPIFRSFVVLPWGGIVQLDRNSICLSINLFMKGRGHWLEFSTILLAISGILIDYAKIGRKKKIVFDTLEIVDAYFGVLSKTILDPFEMRSLLFSDF